MASESCPICGEEKDEFEFDSHGHFEASDDDICDVCGKTQSDHWVVGKPTDHEFILRWGED